MIRFASKELDKWLQQPNRKPAVIRGARQVGKTWLVRDLARRHDRPLIELNFERSPNLADLFSTNNPAEIITNIEAELGKVIDPQRAILFLDEIQATPDLLSKLRWFKEDLPQLPVIAAGSLLEFALKTKKYSMPVGRITYFYLEPMSFLEFVLASGNEPLFKRLSTFCLESGLPQSLHKKCLSLFYDYCLIGGMPEVVGEWAENKLVKNCMKLQQDLLTTYRDDFHKYGGEMDARLLAKILYSVAKQLGNKFVYSRVDSSSKAVPIKTALHLLSLARVCQEVWHTSGNGLPLGAESNEKFFKALMLDIGLTSVQLGLSKINRKDTLLAIFQNRGGLAEQFVGQQLRSSQTPLTDSQLFYWQRIGGRAGEIDYLIQHKNQIIPVEVKSGPAGSMKSLHQFMAEKKLTLAVRLNLNLPLYETVRVKTTMGKAVSYRLLSVPIYLAEQLFEIMGRI